MHSMYTFEAVLYFAPKLPEDSRSLKDAHQPKAMHSQPTPTSNSDFDFNSAVSTLSTAEFESTEATSLQSSTATSEFRLGKRVEFEVRDFTSECRIQNA